MGFMVPQKPRKSRHSHESVPRGKKRIASDQSFHWYFCHINEDFQSSLSEVCSFLWPCYCLYSGEGPSTDVKNRVRFTWNPNSYRWQSPILWDPGAVSGGGEKSQRANFFLARWDFSPPPLTALGLRGWPSPESLQEIWVFSKMLFQEMLHYVKFNPKVWKANPLI